MKTSVLILLFAALAFRASAQEQIPSWAKETKEHKADRLAWWTHDRFGMFIHWGLYSMPARNEGIKRIEWKSDEQYQIYFDLFNPDLFNPKEWARMAREAGMKYVVITTKHLDGFCLWDSKYTDFKAPNTPCGKDLIREVVDAFRAEGLRVGFYYALIDWHHPDFPYDWLHPNSPHDANQRIEANKHRDLKKYQQYMKDQLTELLTQYGRIDELFLDYSYPGENGKGHKEWDAEGILKLVRKLQPQIIVDNRMDLNHTSWGWDFMTPEQYVPYEWPTFNGERAYWELCTTFSGSWGYHRDEATWMTVRQALATLIETVSKGGNLLLNVGPTSRGTIDYRATERLEGIARWMKLNSRSIYGCTAAPDGWEAPRNCMLTYNPKTNRLYIHVLEWPVKSIHLPGYEGKIKYAQLLNDGSELTWYTRTYAAPGDHTFETSRPGDLILNVPVRKPNCEIPVIELILK